MDFDFESEPLGQDQDGNDVFLKDIWPSREGDLGHHRLVDQHGDVHQELRRRVQGRRPVAQPADPEGNTFEWDHNSTYVRKPPYFDGMPAEPDAGRPTSRAPECLPCWVIRCTDRPHLARQATSRPGTPAAQYLDEHGVDKKDYNSYGSRRGNHEVMIRGTFANIRLKNQSARRCLRRLHPRLHPTAASRRSSTTPRKTTQAQDIPLVVLGGKEYGSGSSRDWAAKGTEPAGRAGGDHRVLRAHPPLEPDRDGRHSAAVPRGRVRGVAQAGRHRDVRHHRHRGAQRRQDAEDGARHRHARKTARRSSSTRWCASTHPARRITTATAASCGTCCATC